ncbi:Transporter, LysE family [Pseudomonas sp. FeS53a]|uniref:LysE family translocator n=1 Tax=Pseudomonas sp. FeS53a TaxID=1604022 RepID=UPI0005C8E9E6|nr:LysE family translocator [Pseudomonas sp. FeS53a]KIV75487.1 Transporter, LysE family [Pseudomonas sp. FeS53a]
MDTLSPFALFAFVASITPGPTNLLVLGNAARFGLRRVWPVVLGACAAATAILVLVGLGLGEVLLRLPVLQHVMSTVGFAWLCWLAWGLYRSAGSDLDPNAGRPLGVLGAMGLQSINPKVWMTALVVMGVFLPGASDPGTRVLQLGLVFLLVSVPCMAAWALLGAGSARLLPGRQAQRRFNRLMAVLLFLSACLGLIGGV